MLMSKFYSNFDSLAMVYTGISLMVRDAVGVSLICRP